MTIARRIPLVAMLPFMMSIATSCNNNPRTFTCKINAPKTESARAFCEIDLDITHQDMKNHGFSYGDIVEITASKENYESKKLIIPYVTNYNEAGTYGPCLCDYESRGGKLNIATGFKTKGIKEAGYYADGTCEIKIKKKGGYKKLRDLASVTTKLTYEECGRENMKYANCRDVCEVGTICDHVKIGTLYRGSSPITDFRNKDRFSVADKYMDYHEIKFDVSLSLEDSEVNTYLNEKPEGTYGTYVRGLYNSNPKKLFTTSLGGDFFKTEEGCGGVKIANAFKAIANANTATETSFYIHCNEGKDRTGFFIMILEALCGVPLQDLVYDYMLTFNNYYNITEINNKEKYDAMANLTCYRNIYSFLLAGDDTLTDGTAIYNKLGEIEMLDFDSKSNVEKLLEGKPTDYIQTSAVKYLKKIGLSDGDITNLTSKFQK